MSFLSDEERAECEEMWLIPFNEFKEKITIYKTPLKTIVNSGPNFNFYFDQNSNDISVNYVTQSGSFDAVIEYEARQDQQQIKYATPDSPAVTPEGRVRLSVTGDAKAYLDNIEKIVFDGNNFKINSDVVPHGMFARTEYTYWLSKID